MYLEHYSINRFFFFCHFLKNFVIFLILMLFVSFGVVKFIFLI
ncbi:putative membrane protein [Helicobacter pylori Hp A-11]|uniref:Putative membrane protein n=1 Tax=Helicobacter pylori Hp A-11 TaxID=992035 RepID=N4TAH2_HELPX|nr:putative membrane protein [Helicobacter pylori Hp A-11]